MLLLDTNILIDYLRGKQAAIEFIDCAEKLDLAVNTVIVLELYNGCLNKAELAKIRRILNTLFNKVCKRLCLFSKSAGCGSA